VAAPLRELLRRSQILDAGQLHAQVAAAARQAVVAPSPGSSPEAFVGLLFTKGGVLVLELADAAGFPYPANHEAVWREVNHHLLVQAAEGRGPHPAGDLDVFGEPAGDGNAKMPERKLRRLGNVKLRSLSAAANCQARYGLAEAAACPVGPKAQAELATAQDWLTRPEREGLTWADVSEAYAGGRGAILVAYPSRLPPDPPRLGGLLGGPGRASVRAEARFEAFARTVTERLRGLASAEPRTVVRVFVLAKADTARTRLRYSQQFSVERLLAAAERWQQDARNLPPVFIRRFREEGPPAWRLPLIPFPEEVVLCLNTAWRRAGAESEPVPGVDLGTGLALLLEEGAVLRDAVRTALRLAVANASPLVLALAQAHRLGEVHRPKGKAEQALLLPGVLGLLLAKAALFKGGYMAAAPYLIGRLLSLADKLHLNYCKMERKGQVPPQLLGNSLMPTALESPVAGLARLSERLPLYYRSAPVELRRELAEVEGALNKDALPQRCGDAEKAQMLLGYLARPDLVSTVEAENEQTEPGGNP
jgi:hypothetical protein